MNFLLLSATRFEIEAFMKESFNAQISKTENFYSFAYQQHSIDVLITGVGMVNTAIETTVALTKKKYDFVLQAGVAGTFNKQIVLGEVFNITEDCFSELGAEDGIDFLKIDDLKLSVESTFTNKTILANKVLQEIPKVSGITVNTVHGNETSIEKVWNLFHPYAESMEGAAFMQVCEKFNVPYAQIRSISNYVEKRNREAWKMELAIANLNKKLHEIFKAF